MSPRTQQVHRRSVRSAVLRPAGLLILLIVVVASGALVLNQPKEVDGPKSGFVYRNGATLMLDGAPYRFVGVNNYDLTGCHFGRVPPEADADAYFAGLRPRSVTRAWAFEQQGMAGIEQTIQLAQAHGQKLILALADGAGNCGAPKYDVKWYSSGYTGGYLSWVRSVATRYKDSPAVAIWEIMNEPGLSSDGGLTPDIMKRFYDDVAENLKQVDPNHLVSTGALAPWQTFQEGVAGYAYAHSGPNIDVVSVHEYDYPYSNGQTIVSEHFNTALGAAQQLDKPVYVGETGVSLSKGCMTANQRAAVLRRKFDEYLGLGASGVLYWVVLGPPNNPDDVCDSAQGNRDPSVGGAVMNMIRTYSRPKGRP